MSDPVTLAVLALCAVWFALALRILLRDWKDSPTRIWLSAPVIASVTLMGVTVALWVNERVTEQRLSAVLQEYMGRDEVTVDCQPIDEYLLFNERASGWADVDGDVAYLSHDNCAHLRSYAANSTAKDRPSHVQLWAIATLAHEGSHLDGTLDEEWAECDAVQEMHRIAQQLGATLEQARNAQSRYYDELYWQKDFAYQSPYCAEGGQMDRHRGRLEFP
jgi:hypothetical protein